MVFKRTFAVLAGCLMALGMAIATPASAAPAASGVTSESPLLHKATWYKRRHYGWRGKHYGWRGYGWRGRHYGWRHRGWRGRHYGWRHRGYRKHYGWRGW